MTEKKWLLTSVLFMFCNILLMAQSEINEQSLINRPEIELIIGLNQPNFDHQLLFTDKPNNNSDVNDVITNNNMDNDVTDDDLEDELDELLDELEDLDEPPNEPAKEDLILVKEMYDLDLTIYPNPAKDYIKLRFDKTDEYKVEIYDLIGNKVLSETHSVKLGTELEFDLNNFQTGVYIMHINSNEAMTIKKFAIKH